MYWSCIHQNARKQFEYPGGWVSFLAKNSVIFKAAAKKKATLDVFKPSLNCAVANLNHWVTPCLILLNLSTMDDIPQNGTPLQQLCCFGILWQVTSQINTAADCIGNLTCKHSSFSMAGFMKDLWSRTSVPPATIQSSVLDEYLTAHYLTLQPTNSNDDL